MEMGREERREERWEEGREEEGQRKGGGRERTEWSEGWREVDIIRGTCKPIHMLLHVHVTLGAFVHNLPDKMVGNAKAITVMKHFAGHMSLATRASNSNA